MRACILCRKFVVEDRPRQLGRCRVDKTVDGFYDGFKCPSYETPYKYRVPTPTRDSLMPRMIAAEERIAREKRNRLRGERNRG